VFFVRSFILLRAAIYRRPSLVFQPFRFFPPQTPPVTPTLFRARLCPVCLCPALVGPGTRSPRIWHFLMFVPSVLLFCLFAAGAVYLRRLVLALRRQCLLGPFMPRMILVPHEAFCFSPQEWKPVRPRPHHFSHSPGLVSSCGFLLHPPPLDGGSPHTDVIKLSVFVLFPPRFFFFHLARNLFSFVPLKSGCRLPTAFFVGRPGHDPPPAGVHNRHRCFFFFGFGIASPARCVGKRADV